MSKVTRNTMLGKLKAEDAAAEALSNLPEILQKPTPQNATELVSHGQALDTALSALQVMAHSHHNEAVRDAAARLAAKAGTNQGDLNGPVWSSYLAMRTQADPTSPQQAPALKIETLAQKQTVVALAGERFHEMERAVIERLDDAGTFAGRERNTIYLPARARSFAAAERDGTWRGMFSAPSTNAYGRTLVAQLGPVLPSTVMYAAGASALLGPMAGFAMYLSAAGVSELTADMTVATRSQYNAFGSNLLEERKNPLGVLAERALDSDLWSDVFMPPKDAASKLERESNILQELLALHATGAFPRDGAGVSDRALAVLTKFKSDLDSARVKGGPRLFIDIEAARTAVDKALGKKDIKALDALVPARDTSWTATNQRDLETVMRAQVRGTLFSTNLSLGQLVGDIEGRYKLDELLANVDAGRPGATTPLTSGELLAIRIAAGPTPSMYEVMGLVPLVRAGLLKLTELWPDQQVSVVGMENAASTTQLFEALDELRPGRGKARAAEAIGRIAPWLGASLAGATTFILGWTLVGNLAALVPYLASAVGGGILAGTLKARAAEQRALAGVEAAEGRPVHDPYALALERWSNPSFLSTDDTKLAALLKSEGDALRALVGPQVRQTEKMVALPFMAPAQRKAIEETTLHVGRALEKFADELTALASTRTGPALRTAVAEARARLVGDALVSEVVSAGMLHRTVSARPDPLRTCVEARTDLLTRMNSLVERAGRNEIEPVVIDLIYQARTLEKHGYKKLPKTGGEPFKDALDGFAERILKDVDTKPLAPLDIEAMKTLLASAETDSARWADANKRISRLTSEQAQEQATDFIGEQWGTVVKHLLPPLDLWGEHPDTPKLSLNDVVRSTQKADADDPNSPDVPVLIIKGSVGKDGSCEIRMSERGAVDLESTIRWDSRSLERIATAEARTHYALSFGARTDALDVNVDRKRPGPDGSTVYTVALSNWGRDPAVVEVVVHPSGRLQQPTRMA